MSTTTTTESAISIVYVDSPDEIYHRYPGQSSAQPAYVQLDCEKSVLTVGYSPHIGGGRSLAEHHRRALRWGIPALTVDAANGLLDQLAPLAERILAGYSTRWDGHNRIGVLDEDAEDAETDIAMLCDRDWREHEIQQRMSAADYYAESSRRELLDATGLSAETTDSQLAAIVKDEESRVESWLIVEGIADYLENLRDDLRDEAEDEEYEDEQGGTYAIVDGEQVEMLDEGSCPCCVGGIGWGDVYLDRGSRVEVGQCDCADWRREERGSEWAYTATSRNADSDADASDLAG